jgi:leukotriene-A4 hydrolase
MSNDEILYNRKDYSSFANSDEVISTDIKLEWTLDFDNHRIYGSVDHIVKVLVDGANSVVFDSRNIHLLGDILINNKPAAYVLGEEDSILGTKITVTIPAELRKKETLLSVHIPYRVDPNASAVQWLEPSATKGGKHPYVFTQCQAIHARSLFPCMDSPGIKTPYSAKVTAPKWCTVLMSALASNYITENNKNDSSETNVFHWTQPVPTSPYLVALAAGNLKSLDISNRVRIWAEPEVIAAAHNEFAETEDFVAAAELITGCAYQWNRYDVVCLPPSFPYGGMENPCLTFATPTLLAGDRSLADVIAHEIAHSWTGNLVSNHVWDHFWLNEGWTVWLERKITSHVKHNDEVGRLSSEIGLVHLHESIEQQGPENKFTQLVWPLRGEDPDDAFSSIPYEKVFIDFVLFSVFLYWKGPFFGNEEKNNLFEFLL